MCFQGHKIHALDKIWCHNYLKLDSPAVTAAMPPCSVWRFYIIPREYANYLFPLHRLIIVNSNIFVFLTPSRSGNQEKSILINSVDCDKLCRADSH